MSKKFLVFGARGVQGGPVARALRLAGHEVVTLTRSTLAAEQLRSEGYTPCLLDLGHIDDVLRVADSCDAAFWHVPTGAAANATSPADALIAVLKRSATPRVVVSTSGVVPRDGSSAGAGFAGVSRLAAALRELGPTVATLRPTMFLEDVFDTWPVDRVRREGVLRYPLAVHEPIAWVTAASVGEYAAGLMVRDDWAGGWRALLGACPRSMQDLALSLGDHLRCAVRAIDWPLDEYAASLSPAIGVEAAGRTAKVYAVITENFEQLRMALPHETPVLLGDPVEEWLRDVPR